MGTFRKEGTMEAFRNIYKKNGVGSFWAGWQPKMIESFLKGGILLFSKEAAIRALHTAGVSDVPAGLMGGFIGGVAQDKWILNIIRSIKNIFLIKWRFFAVPNSLIKQINLHHCMTFSEPNAIN